MNDQVTNLIPRIDPEFAALIPPLSPEEYNQLEQNILADKKCRDAIVVWDNTVVDGHNRFRICAAHNIPFEVKEIHFDSRKEALLWILNNQLGRRNLTDAMRIELALSKVELLRQQARENQRRGAARGGSSKPSNKSEAAHCEPSTLTGDEAGSLSDDPSDPAGKLLPPVPVQNAASIDVRKAVANEAGVSHGTVQNYMEVAKHGTPELLESVKSGDMKIKTAYRLLDKEVMKRLKHADKLYDYIEANYPITGNDEANQFIKSRLMDLHRHLKTLLEVKNA